MAGVGMWEFADAIAQVPAGARAVVTATVVRVDEDGAFWCRAAGGGEFPAVRSSVRAAQGDTVSVAIQDGVAEVVGNLTDPSAPATEVDRAAETAGEALSGARAASDAAGAARQLAEAAGKSAAEAADAAEQAQESADSAGRAASAAQESADEAAEAAATADGKAVAAGKAAASAQQAAENAQGDAAKANLYATSALDQLGIVQDVIGVLDWASSHGTFTRTQDAAVDDSKVYFTFDGTDYAPVIDPQASELSTYYELSMSEAMNEYILAHLAVTQRGIWVLPSGIGQASDEQHAPGYKMLLASDGAYIYDSSGALVRSDTASGTDFAEGRSFHFGSDDAYILYTPASGSTPASLVIGGANVQLGSSKTLAEWEADMAQAVDDAAAALDSATLVITSTNGNLFKNGTESTVLQVAVFPNGGGRLDTIADVRERFGAGAYVEWRWKHDSDGTWGTLPTSDPHISNGGMWLTVGPDDVASKTSFEASLVVP